MKLKVPSPEEFFELPKTDKQRYQQIVDAMIADGLKFWSCKMKVRERHVEWCGWTWGDHLCERLFLDANEVIYDAVLWQWQQQNVPLNPPERLN